MKEKKILEKLRKKHPEFVYQNFSWRKTGNQLRINFNFLIKPDIHFQPELVIKNIDSSQIDSLDKKVISNFVFHLGLIEMLSYWKTTCSPIIKIEAGNLNQEQIRWWKELIIKGMGQFFYTNKIDFTRPDFFQIVIAKKDNIFPRYQKAIDSERLLIPIGGGKDSIVSLELLKEAKKRIVYFSLNPTPAIKQVIKLANSSGQIIVERTIDKKLLELNKKGYLNGHTPFSAYLAFLSAFCALLFNCGQIAISQERSSNEGNVNYLGNEINHQYSKSFYFENQFRNYVQKYLSSSLNYFSFLRPLYEIQIARLFSRYPKYFSIFKSCNVGQKTNSWCGRCSKCLFVFTCLYPFLKKEELIKIFGEDLFEKKSLLPITEDLIGLSEHKPFECVGTREENLIAFYLSFEKAEKENEKLPFILQYFKEEILTNRSLTSNDVKEILETWNKKNNLAEDFENIFKKSIK